MLAGTDVRRGRETDGSPAEQATNTHTAAAGAGVAATSAEIGPRGKWTAAGAARLVREARIATARYMRDAETGQLWEMTRLAEAYTVWLEHLRAQVAELSPQPDDDTVRGTASALLFGGSGLTAPYPASFDGPRHGSSTCAPPIWTPPPCPCCPRRCVTW